MNAHRAAHSRPHVPFRYHYVTERESSAEDASVGLTQKANVPASAADNVRIADRVDVFHSHDLLKQVLGFLTVSFARTLTPSLRGVIRLR